MLITYADQLCKLMSSQIDKMSNQNEDWKDTCPVKEEKLYPELVIGSSQSDYFQLVLVLWHSVENRSITKSNFTAN